MITASILWFLIFNWLFFQRLPPEFILILIFAGFWLLSRRGQLGVPLRLWTCYTGICPFFHAHFLLFLPETWIRLSSFKRMAQAPWKVFVFPSLPFIRAHPWGLASRSEKGVRHCLDSFAFETQSVATFLPTYPFSFAITLVNDYTIYFTLANWSYLQGIFQRAYSECYFFHKHPKREVFRWYL